jgi:hypothetical protein
MNQLNGLTKEIMGKPMTKKQQAFIEMLRLKVKKKQLTVEQAKKAWFMLKDDLEDISKREGEKL